MANGKNGQLAMRSTPGEELAIYSREALHIPDVHVFHAHYHVIVVIEEGTVESDDIIGMATMHDLKFAHNSLAHLLVGLDVDDLVRGRKCQRPYSSG